MAAEGAREGRPKGEAQGRPAGVAFAPCSTLSQPPLGRRPRMLVQLHIVTARLDPETGCFPGHPLAHLLLCESLPLRQARLRAHSSPEQSEVASCR